MNYPEFRTTIFSLYGQQKYDEALAVIHAEARRFPEHAVRILYWQACVEGLAGQAEAALHSLQTLAEHGLWYDPEQVRGDPDLEILRGRPEFDAVLAAFAEQQAAAQRQAQPELLAFAPPENRPGPYPLLIALHGRNDNAGNFSIFFQQLAYEGWLVALPQSSVILASECYGWDDRELAAAEIAAHFAELQREFPIDPRRVVLAGFSQGGGLSIWLAATGRIPAAAFLAFAPYLHGVESLAIEPAPAHGLRGWMFTGDQDPHQEMFVHFTTLLERSGIPCEHRRYPELGHYLPPDYAQSIPEVLGTLFPPISGKH
jgi:predicted esterase